MNATGIAVFTYDLIFVKPSTLKTIAATATVIGIFMGFFERWFAPTVQVTEESPDYPDWLGWLGWIIASAAAVAYIVVDKLEQKRRKRTPKQHEMTELPPERKPAEERIELLKCTIEARTGVLKAFMLINGGGAAAMLTFIGHLITSPNTKPEMANDLALSVILFSCGVLVTTLGGVFSYFQVRELGQRHDTPQTEPHVGEVQIFTIGMFSCWLLAALLFIGGVQKATKAFLKERPNSTPSAVSKP